VNRDPVEDRRRGGYRDTSAGQNVHMSACSEMGRIPPHPGCFRMSGNQRTYGIRNLEEGTEDGRSRKGIGIGGAPHPRFFVSVAAKGFSQAVSLLFATFAGRSISVAAKGLREIGSVCTSERLNV